MPKAWMNFMNLSSSHEVSHEGDNPEYQTQRKFWKYVKELDFLIRREKVTINKKTTVLPLQTVENICYFEHGSGRISVAIRAPGGKIQIGRTGPSEARSKVTTTSQVRENCY